MHIATWLSAVERRSVVRKKRSGANKERQEERRRKKRTLTRRLIGVGIGCGRELVLLGGSGFGGGGALGRRGFLRRRLLRGCGFGGGIGVSSSHD